MIKKKILKVDKKEKIHYIMETNNKNYCLLLIKNSANYKALEDL